MAGRGLQANEAAPRDGGKGARILIIDAPYYQDISDALLAGAIAELEAAGASSERIVVPGALEIPLALSQAIKAGLIGSEGAAGSLIEKSMRIISEEGRGVIVLIRDPQPKSVSTWIAQSKEKKRPKKADAERRLVEIGVGSQILRDLGVADMVLLSNAPPSRYVGLEAFGLRIVSQRRIG